MKKIIGFILLALFTILMGITCYVFGWEMGMIMWGISSILALIIVIATYLIDEDE